MYSIYRNGKLVGSSSDIEYVIEFKIGRAHV